MVKKDSESSVYYKPEPFPLDVSELNIEAKTKSGLAVKIASQKEATLRRFDKVRNPNLLCLADFENGKVYMKKDDGSLWLLAHSEDGSVWIKLKNYIMETLEALCLNYHRNFQNPIPKNIRITQKIRAKMLEQIDIIEKGKMVSQDKRVYTKCLQNNGLFSNLIRAKESSEKVVCHG